MRNFKVSLMGACLAVSSITTGCDRVDTASVVAAAAEYDRVLLMRMGPLVRAGAAADSLQVVVTRGAEPEDQAIVGDWLQRVEAVDLEDLPPGDRLWTDLSAREDVDPRVMDLVTLVDESRRDLQPLLESARQDRARLLTLMEAGDGWSRLHDQPDVLQALHESLLSVAREIGRTSIRLERLRGRLESQTTP